MGFEPTIPASEQAKTVHASDCSATMTGHHSFYITEIIRNNIRYLDNMSATGGEVYFLNFVEEQKMNAELTYTILLSAF
jgi:hypothetical protein